MRKDASIWSLISFSYVLPLLQAAYDSGDKLTIEQLGELPESISIEKTVPLIEQAFIKQREMSPHSDKAVVWALTEVFRWRIISKFLLQLVFKAVSMITPLLIFNFTEFVEKDNDDLLEDDYKVASVVACCIIGLEMIERFAHAIFDFHIQSVGELATKAMKVTLCNKNFRMSSTGKKNYTFAQV